MIELKSARKKARRTFHLLYPGHVDRYVQRHFPTSSSIPGSCSAPINPSTLQACRDWLNLTPDYALAMIKSLRIGTSHRYAPPADFQHPSTVHTCTVYFDFHLDVGGRARSRFQYHSGANCMECSPQHRGEHGLISRVTCQMAGMGRDSKLSRRRLMSILDAIEGSRRLGQSQHLVHSV